MGEHSQRRTHLEESSVVLTLKHVERGGGEGREGSQVQQAGAKDAKEAETEVTRMSGLHRGRPLGEGQPSPRLENSGLRWGGIPAIPHNR